MIYNWPYILLLTVICFLLFLRKKLSEKDKRKVSFCICCCLIIFSGFRFQVGTDYPGYARMYELIGIFGRYYNIEWGYYGLVKLCQWIGANAQLVFLAFSFTTIYFVYLYIEHFSEDVELSWFLFICIGPYFLSTFNGMRQWLAIAVFAYSLRYVKDKKFNKYLIINCVAGLIHYSAFIMIPLYFVLKSKSFNMKKAIVCYIGLQLFHMMGGIRFLANILHAASYLGGDSALELDATYYLFFAMSVVCWLYSLIIHDENKDSHYIFRSMNLMSCLTVFLAISANGISNMVFTRLNQYFFIGYIILVPQMLSTFKKSRSIFTIVIYLLSFLYYFLLTRTASDLTPYRMNFILFS